MQIQLAEQKVKSVLEGIDIHVNGANPWDITVHNPRFYKQVLAEPSLGLGESYMDGFWDCEQLDDFFYRLLHNVDLKDIYKPWTLIQFVIKNAIVNQQSRLRSKKVAEVHYNLSHELYQAILGETMAYTCGYWRNAKTLDAAQNAKYELVCQKLGLEPGDRVLELGCGFGGFSHYAAKNYNCELVAVNISEEQVNYAKKLCAGLPVKVYMTDYRDVGHYNPEGIQFDKVVSIGMCEHVGYKNYRSFISLARQQIKEDGLFLLHTIGKNTSFPFGDPWMRKYIFPSGMLPSIKLLGAAFEKQFVVEDLHNFGADYDKTLVAWWDNFDRHWPELKSNYDERFYRMWRYYLLACAGSFRAREIQLWQYVLSPKGVLSGYVSVR